MTSSCRLIGGKFFQTNNLESCDLIGTLKLWSFENRSQKGGKKWQKCAYRVRVITLIEYFFNFQNPNEPVWGGDLLSNFLLQGPWHDFYLQGPWHDVAEATKKRLGGSTWRYHFIIIRMSYVDMSTCPSYQSCQFQSKIAQIAKVTKIPTCSAIRDGAVHSEESSKGSRGTSCSNKRTYQDHQV